MKAAIILCAGKQKRFNSIIPKALYPFNNLTVLHHNLKLISGYVDRVFIVTSIDNKSYFDEYRFEDLYSNVEIFSIYSGFGCGDGVYKSLKKIPDDFRDITLIWGDSIQNAQTIKILQEKELANNFIIPVCKEEKPYVQICEHDGFVYKVNFSKFNDKIDNIAWHDLSIFRFTKQKCLDILNKMINIYFTNGKYITRSRRTYISWDV